MSAIDQYQEKISGNDVAGLVIEFHQRLRDVYPMDVMASPLCAVGPLQTMIGLGIDMGIITTPATPAPVTKCHSIWGHKFEAVYDYGPVVGKYTAEGASAAHHERMADKMRQQTYLHHVCTRCGTVVNRTTPNQTGEVDRT